MDLLDFSEEEIRQQLALLGYKNIPKHRLLEFKQDLDELIRRGEWRSLVSPPQTPPQPSPPAYTKEKVSSTEGFFLHAARDRDTQTLLTHPDRGDRGQRRPCDSYAHHSVAPKLQLAAGGPCRLQVEPDPNLMLNSTLSDSHTSSLDSQERRFIKRKVLRKHHGQRHICDESVYSEDSDEKEVDAKPVRGTAKSEVNDQENQSKDSLKEGSHSDTEEEEEEEEKSSDDRNSYFDSDEDEEEKEFDTKPVEATEDSIQKKKQDKSRESLEEESHADGEEEEDEDSSDDRNSSYSSFYSDEEDEEEEVNAKPVGANKASSQKTSVEEKSELNDQENQSREGLEEESHDAEEEEEEGSDDDENSLYSCFWSDGEKREEENEIHIKPVEDPKDSMRETPPEEKLQMNSSRESLLEGGHEQSEEDKEDEGEEMCSSTPDSPTPSLMTSGYGTYRPEEQEGDYRDDQDSRGDLSDIRDEDYDQRSLCSVTHTHRSQPAVCVLEQHTAAADGQSERHELVNRPDLISEQEKPAGEKKCGDVCAAAAEGGHVKAESEDGNEEKLEEESQDVGEMKRAEKEDSDETSSNKDIKFIDCKAGLSWTTFDRMSLEWEGNLRHTDTTSCLEERLAELHISPSARPDEEDEDEEEADQSSQHSSDSEAGSLSAFGSYVRGLTRTRSDGDLRPKPKSFIRPVVSQQSIKKSDPVARYFQYKQLWDMLKCPGEADRRALRWEIKERLAYQPPPPKPRRVYVPNTYIVPTEKKRSALRWEVRTDLANGRHPYKSSCRF